MSHIYRQTIRLNGGSAMEVSIFVKLHKIALQVFTQWVFTTQKTKSEHHQTIYRKPLKYKRIKIEKCIHSKIYK